MDRLSPSSHHTSDDDSDEWPTAEVVTIAPTVPPSLALSSVASTPNAHATPSLVATTTTDSKRTAPRATPTLVTIADASPVVTTITTMPIDDVAVTTTTASPATSPAAVATTDASPTASLCSGHDSGEDSDGVLVDSAPTSPVLTAAAPSPVAPTPIPTPLLSSTTVAVPVDTNSTTADAPIAILTTAVPTLSPASSTSSSSLSSIEVAPVTATPIMDAGAAASVVINSSVANVSAPFVASSAPASASVPVPLSPGSLSSSSSSPTDIASPAHLRYLCVTSTRTNQWIGPDVVSFTNDYERTLLGCHVIEAMALGLRFDGAYLERVLIATSPSLHTILHHSLALARVVPIPARDHHVSTHVVVTASAPPSTAAMPPLPSSLSIGSLSDVSTIATHGSHEKNDTNSGRSTVVPSSSSMDEFGVVPAIERAPSADDDDSDYDGQKNDGDGDDDSDDDRATSRYVRQMKDDESLARELTKKAIVVPTTDTKRRDTSIDDKDNDKNDAPRSLRASLHQMKREETATRPCYRLREYGTCFMGDACLFSHAVTPGERAIINTANTLASSLSSSSSSSTTTTSSTSSDSKRSIVPTIITTPEVAPASTPTAVPAVAVTTTATVPVTVTVPSPTTVNTIADGLFEQEVAAAQAKLNQWLAADSLLAAAIAADNEDYLYPSSLQPNGRDKKEANDDQDGNNDDDTAPSAKYDDDISVDSIHKLFVTLHHIITEMDSDSSYGCGWIASVTGIDGDTFVLVRSSATATMNQMIATRLQMPSFAVLLNQLSQLRFTIIEEDIELTPTPTRHEYDDLILIIDEPDDVVDGIRVTIRLPGFTRRATPDDLRRLAQQIYAMGPGEALSSTLASPMMKPMASSGSSGEIVESWKCQQCPYVNYSSKTICYRCLVAKPSTVTTSSSEPVASSESTTTSMVSAVASTASTSDASSVVPSLSSSSSSLTVPIAVAVAGPPSLSSSRSTTPANASEPATNVDAIFATTIEDGIAKAKATVDSIRSTLPIQYRSLLSPTAVTHAIQLCHDRIASLKRLQGDHSLGGDQDDSDDDSGHDDDDDDNGDLLTAPKTHIKLLVSYRNAMNHWLQLSASAKPSSSSSSSSSATTTNIATRPLASTTNEWTCDVCTCSNPFSSPTCDVCESVRPRLLASASSSRVRHQLSDVTRQMAATVGGGAGSGDGGDEYRDERAMNDLQDRILHAIDERDTMRRKWQRDDAQWLVDNYMASMSSSSSSSSSAPSLSSYSSTTPVTAIGSAASASSSVVAPSSSVSGESKLEKSSTSSSTSSLSSTRATTGTAPPGTNGASFIVTEAKIDTSVVLISPAKMEQLALFRGDVVVLSVPLPSVSSSSSTPSMTTVAMVVPDPDTIDGCVGMNTHQRNNLGVMIGDIIDLRHSGDVYATLIRVAPIDDSIRNSAIGVTDDMLELYVKPYFKATARALGRGDTFIAACHDRPSIEFQVMTIEPPQALSCLIEPNTILECDTLPVARRAPTRAPVEISSSSSPPTKQVESKQRETKATVATSSSSASTSSSAPSYPPFSRATQPLPPVDPSLGTGWQCHTCTYFVASSTGIAHDSCPICRTPRGNIWTCEICTLTNINRRACEACGTVQPLVDAIKVMRHSNNSWDCPRCHHTNAPSAHGCSSCRLSAAEIRLDPISNTSNSGSTSAPHTTATTTTTAVTTATSHTSSSSNRQNDEYKPKQDDDGWQCYRCTAMNQSHVHLCYVCDAHRFGRRDASIRTPIPPTTATTSTSATTTPGTGKRHIHMDVSDAINADGTIDTKKIPCVRLRQIGNCYLGSACIYNHDGVKPTTLHLRSPSSAAAATAAAANRRPATRVATIEEPVINASSAAVATTTSSSSSSSSSSSGSGSNSGNSSMSSDVPEVEVPLTSARAQVEGESLKVQLDRYFSTMAPTAAATRDMMTLLQNKHTQRLIRQQYASVNGLCWMDMDQSTYLHKAVADMNVELTTLLLAFGANPNVGTLRGGRTPLHIACAHFANNTSDASHTVAARALVEALLLYGADRTLVDTPRYSHSHHHTADGEGRTPFGMIPPSVLALPETQKWLATLPAQSPTPISTPPVSLSSSSSSSSSAAAAASSETKHNTNTTQSPTSSTSSPPAVPSSSSSSSSPSTTTAAVATLAVGGATVGVQWMCSSCTYANPIASLSCAMCNGARGALPPMAAM